MCGGGTEGIDEVGNEIFFFGASADGFFFVFDDDFVVVNFDDFVTGYNEFRVGKGFEGRAFDDELLDHEILLGDDVINNVT